MTSKVSFVSSGPGDPDLLTVKAVKKIKDADLIFYDDLSSGEILKLASSDATLFSVGKRAGLKSPKQAQVSALLVDYGKTGKKIVRLKSGDCGIFSRLEEEINALEKNNIPFEIIPGVSSAVAAAAAAKIPLTRRVQSRRLQFITGHDFNGALPDDLHIDSLTDPNSTTVIFMGKKTFPNLSELLIKNKMDQNTNALVIENVSRSNEKITKGSILEIADYLLAKTENEPAIIIFGSIM
jgi:uroporphyrin-III C-methyltransferase